jgi:hypothetical protein
MYTDPTGEFYLIDSWLSGFFKGLFKDGLKEAWNTANQTAMNDIKIWGGLFASDPNKNFWQRTWEVISRSTWQLPQTLVGFTFSQAGNLGWQVDKANYWGGATVLSGNFFGSGSTVTLGNYINGSQNLAADPNNTLFQHEYGHYLQSQSMGWAYLPRIGIPSILSKGDHRLHPVEQDANRRAFLYFNKNVADFQDDISIWDNQGWDFWRNPLNIDRAGRDHQYIDFQDENQRRLLEVLNLSPKWYDHASWLLYPIGPIGVGLINTNAYK